MEYEREELAAVAGRLIKRYAGYESTSVTYETAQQLMEAALYCIREAKEEEREERPEESTLQAGGSTAAAFDVKRLNPPPGSTALQAYEAGAARVERKVKQALAWYNGLLPEFRWYGNRCLRDTVLKELPEFFKRYNILFAPQETIITPDYPVYRDLSAYTGIDRIHGFIACLRREQEFLRSYPEEYVWEALARYGGGADAVENLCEAVFLADAFGDRAEAGRRRQQWIAGGCFACQGRRPQ